MSRPDDSQKLAESLRRQHTKLDQRVQEFASRRWLSSNEEQEEKRLKRLKLVMKDRLETLRPEL